MNREEIQNIAVELAKKQRNIALQWATGIGKSKCAINIINYFRPTKVLLVVAEISHKENWQKEFKKWKLCDCNVTIECYASLKNYVNTEWDFIVLDEAHHIGSEIRLDIISTLKANHLILLSATLPDNVLSTLEVYFGKIVSYKVPLKKAIEEELLPEPKIYLVPLKLNNISKNCTIEEEWGKSESKKAITCSYQDRWKYLRNRKTYPNVKLNILCTERQKYDYLTEQFEYWKKQYLSSRAEYLKNKWLQFGSKRKRFLSEIKTTTAKRIIELIKDKRFICFCGSIEQAELLSKNNCIHSKKLNSLDIINSFNNKEINNLFAVGMTQEGTNLTDIEAGIIIQLDGQERAFIQKSGRVYRAKDPIQFILYIENTRDEEYLNNILEGVNPSYITKIKDLNSFTI